MAGRWIRERNVPTGASREAAGLHTHGSVMVSVGPAFLIWLHRCCGCPVQDSMTDLEALKDKLEALKLEHRDLDDVISRIAESGRYDQLQIKRLKKRKLILKDQIAQLESCILPDIIA